MRISILDVRDGVCEMSGREGEVAIIETDDEPGRAAVSFKALMEMARFRAKQEAKRNNKSNGVGTE